MTKTTKCILASFFVLLILLSISFVGCSKNSNGTAGENTTAPENINYFQTLADYTKTKGKYIESQKYYELQFLSPSSSATYKTLYGWIDYVPEKDSIQLNGYDSSSRTSFELQIPNLKEYKGHIYKITGAFQNSYNFSLSCSAENTTVTFDAHQIPMDNQAEFQTKVATISNVITSIIQSFSGYCGKNLYNFTDALQCARTFCLPVSVNIQA